MKIAILILVIAFALYIMIPAYPGRKMDVLSDKAEKNEKNLEKGAAKMFKDFPPGSAKR